MSDSLLAQSLTASENLLSTAEYDNKCSIARYDIINRPVVYIGLGTCGIISGANKTKQAIVDYLNEKNVEADIVEVGCIGICSYEPIVDVQIPGKARISFKNIYSDMVEKLLDDVFNQVIPTSWVIGQYQSDIHSTWENIPFINQIPFLKYQHRIVLKNCGIINTNSIDHYIALGGFSAYKKCIKNYSPEKVRNIVTESGLRGRGGGGYHTGLKWGNACKSDNKQRFLICNASESDPGSFMDRAIIEGDPFLLLEGIAIAAYAIEASKAIVYIMTEYTNAYNKIKQAVDIMKQNKLLGNNIFNSNIDLEIDIIKSPGAFVSGEETALINSIMSKRAMPHHKPPYPTEQGLFNSPTVINNVETLANIPNILLYGPNKFKEIGTPLASGTKVFGVSGKTDITGLVEVVMGTKLHDIVYKISGGIKQGKDFKAIQIGGPSGSCLPYSMLDIEVGYETLWEHDTILGSGGIVVMDETTCMVDITKFFMYFLQKESCGKCIPCREGSRRIYEILQSITSRSKSKDENEELKIFKSVLQLTELAKVLKDTSLCGLGKTAPNPLLSALKYFKHEFDEHIFDKKCRAGFCTELKLYAINTDNCTGCTLCLKKCPSNAIVGQPRQPHYIVEDKCIGCGICDEVCKFNAVFIQ